MEPGSGSNVIPRRARPSLASQTGASSPPAIIPQAVYKGTSLLQNCILLGPYSRSMPMVVLRGLKFLMSEVPLCVVPAPIPLGGYNPKPHTHRSTPSPVLLIRVVSS